jgi:hypothetical protein
VGGLLDACLPPSKPVKSKPLDPPAPDEGVQIVLPQYLLKAQTEIEHCTPFAYDLSDKVPAKYKDTARKPRARTSRDARHTRVVQEQLAVTASQSAAAASTPRDSQLETVGEAEV